MIQSLDPWFCALELHRHVLERPRDSIQWALAIIDHIIVCLWFAIYSHKVPVFQTVRLSFQQKLTTVFSADILFQAKIESHWS